MSRHAVTSRAADMSWTTKELLDEAEAQLTASYDVDSMSKAARALQSIAASQLVIARASAGIRAK